MCRHLRHQELHLIEPSRQQICNRIPLQANCLSHLRHRLESSLSFSRCTSARKLYWSRQPPSWQFTRVACLAYHSWLICFRFRELISRTKEISWTCISLNFAGAGRVRYSDCSYTWRGSRPAAIYSIINFINIINLLTLCLIAKLVTVITGCN